MADGVDHRISQCVYRVHCLIDIFRILKHEFNRKYHLPHVHNIIAKSRVRADASGAERREVTQHQTTTAFSVPSFSCDAVSLFDFCRPLSFVHLSRMGPAILRRPPSAPIIAVLSILFVFHLFDIPFFTRCFCGRLDAHSPSAKRYKKWKKRRKKVKYSQNKHYTYFKFSRFLSRPCPFLGLLFAGVFVLCSVLSKCRAQKQKAVSFGVIVVIPHLLEDVLVWVAVLARPRLPGFGFHRQRLIVSIYFCILFRFPWLCAPLFGPPGHCRGIIECKEPIEVVSYKIGVCKVSAKGKECTTVFQKLGYNGKTSVVLCKPKTGRMHQIRVHLQFLGEY